MQKSHIYVREQYTIVPVPNTFLHTKPVIRFSILYGINKHTWKFANQSTDSFTVTYEKYSKFIKNCVSISELSCLFSLWIEYNVPRNAYNWPLNLFIVEIVLLRSEPLKILFKNIFDSCFLCIALIYLFYIYLKKR